MPTKTRKQQKDVRQQPLDLNPKPLDAATAKRAAKVAEKTIAQTAAAVSSGRPVDLPESVPMLDELDGLAEYETDLEVSPGNVHTLPFAALINMLEGFSYQKNAAEKAQKTIAAKMKAALAMVPKTGVGVHIDRVGKTGVLRMVEGKSAEKIDPSLLRQHLLDRIPAKDIDDIITACTTGGGTYTYPRVYLPGEK